MKNDLNTAEAMSDPNSETNTLWRKHVGFSPKSAADAYELCGKLEKERDELRRVDKHLRNMIHGLQVQLTKALEAVAASHTAQTSGRKAS